MNELVPVLGAIRPQHQGLIISSKKQVILACSEFYAARDTPSDI